MKFYILCVLLLCIMTTIDSQNIIPGCPGCSVKGICYFPNQEWLQGCWTKKCIVYPGGFGWRTNIVKTRE